MRAQAAEISGGDTRRVEEEVILQADQGQSLQLPLVDDDFSVANVIEITGVAGVRLELASEFGRADALGAFAENQDSAAWLDDVLRGSDSFEDLIKGEVEWIACGARDDNVGRRRNCCKRSGYEKVDSGGVGLDRMSSKDA